MKHSDCVPSQGPEWPEQRREILAVIRVALDLPGDFNFPEGIRPSFVPGWDSLGWMHVILALEEALGMPLDLDVLEDVVTVDDLCRVMAVELPRRRSEAV